MVGLRPLPVLTRLAGPFAMPVRNTPSRGKRPGRFHARFLRGPVSWPWLTCAAQLPGRALHVAVAIRLWVGITKKDRIALPLAELARMGVTRHAAYRGVGALERAGLLAVTRHVGRKTLVRVIERTEDTQP